MSSVLPTRETKVAKVAEQPKDVESKPQIVVDSKLIEVPYVVQPTTGLQDTMPNRRCDLGLISSGQLLRVKALRRGLIASGKKLANGQEVKSNKDAILCLIEMLEV